MVVVGGGPAGAVSGWALASRGVRVLVLDRARFPREKVCGDFVEPRGLRLFARMGCLRTLEARAPLAITHVNMFIDGNSAYRGPIPFYASQTKLPTHGYIIPREELDHRLLAAARKAGAEVHEGCHVMGVEQNGGAMAVRVRDRGSDKTLQTRIVIGADGTNSIVARCAGLLADDPRYMAVSQRAYVEGVDVGRGEAAFLFDRDLFPGYGWMFPMAHGHANVGVGILAETRDRYQINVPSLLDAFLRKLRRIHAGCASVRLASKPIGGVVKTYGGRGRNYFDGGILVGDAGSFVDPMTGEGITPAAESALLGAEVVADALERGRTDAATLSAYERAFSAYFDPAMCYVDFCACLMRNRYLREFWLSVVARGCALAMRDRGFARIGGAPFGGMSVQPLDVIFRTWAKNVGQFAAHGGHVMTELLRGRSDAFGATLGEVTRWHTGWWSSVVNDPVWHARWMGDLTTKFLRLYRTTTLRDPRVRGPAQLRLTPSARSG